MRLQDLTTEELDLVLAQLSGDLEGAQLARGLVTSDRVYEQVDDYLACISTADSQVSGLEKLYQVVKEERDRRT